MPGMPGSLHSATMDFYSPANSSFQFGVDRAHDRPRPSRPLEKEDRELQFLSREERECILFLEETIDSLDQDLEDPNMNLSSSSTVPVQAHDLRGQDIIDLVRSRPSPAEPREAVFNHTEPGFHSMAVNPEAHFELKAKREPMENFPSDYTFRPSSPPTAPSGPSDKFDSYSHPLYQPAGSIPTPVLIAQKMAQHRAGPTAPSTILYDQPPLSSSLDLSVRQGPPITSKPTHYPSNINLNVGNKETYNQTITMASVNVQERQALMLSNLTGTSHALEVTETPAGNARGRSISFRDPGPDRSHMEALSKLGLSRDPGLPSSHGSSSRTIAPSSPWADKPQASVNNVSSYDSKPGSNALLVVPFAKTEISSGGKSKLMTPSTMSNTKTDLDSQHMISHNKSKNLSPQSSESISDFNNYGGKTKVMTPAPITRSDIAPQSTSNFDSRPKIVSSPLVIPGTKSEVSDFNNYGGKTKVITPFPESTATEMSSNIVSSNSKTKAIASSSSVKRTAASPNDLTSYDGRTKAMIPSPLSSSRPEASPSHSSASVMTQRPATTPPNRPDSRASEMARQSRQGRGSSFHGCEPPDVRRMSVSKSAFRPQGISVQFSGRGATDESRRAALRKLGLFKETP